MDKEDWKNTFVPERAEEALNALWGAFTWEDTPEGHDYWAKITDRLEAMLKQHKKTKAE